MTLFKKKTEQPALFYVLDDYLKEARKKGEKCFYYPLLDREIQKAQVWSINHHLWMEVDHKRDNNIYYKFYGI